jgi:hypothetical protein
MTTDRGSGLNRFLKELNRNRNLNSWAHLIEKTLDFRLVFPAERRSFKVNLNHWIKR